MRSTCEFNNRSIPAEQRLDVGQVLFDGGLVALPLVALVPLIVVVKDECDDVLKTVDESVRRGRIDQAVKSTVETDPPRWTTDKAALVKALVEID